MLITNQITIRPGETAVFPVYRDQFGYALIHELSAEHGPLATEHGAADLENQFTGQDAGRINDKSSATWLHSHPREVWWPAIAVLAGQIVERIEVEWWQPYAPSEYVIEYTTDNVAWQPFETTGPPGRYRVYVPASETWMAMQEMRLFGRTNRPRTRGAAMGVDYDLLFDDNDPTVVVIRNRLDHRADFQLYYHA